MRVKPWSPAGILDRINKIEDAPCLNHKLHITYPELTVLSTSGHDRRRLQNAIVGFSGGRFLGTRRDPPRRWGVAGAKQSKVRRLALRADAPSVGRTRGKPGERYPY
ncbi:unnamed protein product [Colias eurytheme]|nr:unnamed protein product [Colias eurytheme]